MTEIGPSRSQLARVVTQRPGSLFATDLETHAESVAAAVTGKRLLVIGGAGSIGSATVLELAAFSPQQLHVVDLDENSLTELVRDLRSRAAVSPETDLRLTPADFGGPIMRRLLRDSDGYDLVLNFAAIKHVRSEKDVYSLLRMLYINVVAPRRLLDWLTELEVPRYFAVSTDKAANPVNIMGATKRAMELMMFDARLPQVITSARFANVAFSNGSLLDGWLRRLEKRQAWAVPTGTRRFFVTPEESGQLCLLAATMAPDRSVVIPDLDPEQHLRDLVEVAEDVLDHLGLTPRRCTTEAEARSLALAATPGSWPVLLTALDTSGEKEFEEFAAAEDVVQHEGFAALATLTSPQADPAALDTFLAEAADLVERVDRPVSADDVISCVQTIVPGLTHRRSQKMLDTRM